MRVAALVTMGLFLTFAAGAAAQAAPPPTLTGEGLFDSVVTVKSMTCISFPGRSPFQAARGTFEAQGIAEGPYPGPFQVTGSAIAFGGANGNTFSRLTATFRIESPVGRVVGTERSTNVIASCTRLDPTALLTFTFSVNGVATTDTYHASISTASGEFVDTGLFRASSFGDFADEFRSALALPKQLLPITKNELNTAPGSG